MTIKRKMTKDFAKSMLSLYGTVFKATDLSKTMQMNCMLHGLCQKLIDSTAGMNSKDYTDDERKAKVAEVWETLKKDQWTKPGESKATMKKKVDEAVEKANVEQAEVLHKLGLITAEEFNAKVLEAKAQQPKA